MIKKNKILITGSTGFVGNFFSKYLSNKFPEIELFRIGFSKKINGVISVDLSNLNKTKKLIDSINPTHVFHFAAMVNPKLNEENKVESFQKNFTITNNIVSSCSSETSIIFLSTDKVYNALNRNAVETDFDVPNNFYSLMKLISENIISNNFYKHFILRCPIIHGKGDLNSNSFIDSALIKLKNKQEISVFDNVVRHYVLINELVDFMIDLIFSEKYGTYNIGSQPMTYFERIFLLAKEQNFSTRLISKSNGLIDPEIQTYSLKKTHLIFNKKFN